MSCFFYFFKIVDHDILVNALHCVHECTTGSRLKPWVTSNFFQSVLLFYCGTLLMSELWHCLILLGVLEVFWFYATLIIFVDNNNNNNNNNITEQRASITTRYLVNGKCAKQAAFLLPSLLYSFTCLPATTTKERKREITTVRPPICLWPNVAAKLWLDW